MFFLSKRWVWWPWSRVAGSSPKWLPKHLNPICRHLDPKMVKRACESSTDKYLTPSCSHESFCNYCSSTSNCTDCKQLLLWDISTLHFYFLRTETLSTFLLFYKEAWAINFVLPLSSEWVKISDINWRSIHGCSGKSTVMKILSWFTLVTPFFLPVSPFKNISTLKSIVFPFPQPIPPWLFKVLSALILSPVLYITYVLLAFPQRSQFFTSS